MRLAGFIITFNRPERLGETIERTLAQTLAPERLLIVDNGDPDLSGPVVRRFDSRVVSHQVMGDNLGAAGAAAYGLGRLVEEGYEWVSWGDDDTPPLNESVFERLLNLATDARQVDVGGVGAVGARFDWARGELRRLPDDALVGAVEVDSIGSGQQLITHREVVRRAGLPDARLFFGFYDPEFCLRVRRAGLRLLVDGDLMLTYRRTFGKTNRRQTTSMVPRNPSHALWRRYYVTRNYIFMMRQTFGRPELARREALKAIGRSCTAWLRGPRYGLDFARLQLAGVLDGYRGRLGRTVLPVPKKYPTK